MNRVFWLYGRSGAGKTTLANRLVAGLASAGLPVFLLDGDALRAGLCRDLGFETKDRLENHRRMACVAALARDQGLNVVAASMAPEHLQRDVVTELLGESLTWVYVHASLDTCIQRDPKGLYRKARNKEIGNLLLYPFEVPRPGEREIYINTEALNPDEAYRLLRDEMKAKLASFTI